MNSLQIQYFLAAVTNENLTKAARQLYVSQPAVSRQISLLEQEVGHKFFTRQGKSIHLTYAGQAFYDYFTRCRDQMEQVQERLREQEASGLFPVRIAYLQGLAPRHFLPQMETAAASPDSPIRLRTACYSLPRLIECLRAGDVDLILTFGSSLASESFYSEPLVEVPRVLLYSAAKYPEPRKDLGQFRDETFLLPGDEHTSQLEQTLMNQILRYGFTPRIRYAPNYDTIIDQVEQGKGVFIYNAWCRPCDQAAFHSLPLPDSQTLYLSRKYRAASPEILKFLEAFRLAMST